MKKDLMKFLKILIIFKTKINYYQKIKINKSSKINKLQMIQKKIYKNNNNSKKN